MTAKILVVEDELIVGRMIQKKLLKLGYEVSGHASYGREAIELAAQTDPDLVLMDIVLKGDMDGITAAQAIINRFQIPIIYLTAYADEKILKRAMITEPHAYILKPFREEELKANIQMALHKDRVEKKRNEVILKRLLAEYHEFMLDQIYPDDFDKVTPYLQRLEKRFEDSFEEEAVISWDQELEKIGLNLDHDAGDIILEFFSSWITSLYADLGIRNRLTNDDHRLILELFNCPWISFKHNHIFCLNCQAMLNRSFNWAGLKGSIKNISSIIEGNSHCRFIIKANP